MTHLLLQIISPQAQLFLHSKQLSLVTSFICHWFLRCMNLLCVEPDCRQNEPEVLKKFYMSIGQPQVLTMANIVLVAIV